MRRILAAATAAAMVMAGGALAQAGAPGDPPPPVDYRQRSAWLCRPGVDDGTCSAGLDAVAVDAAGNRTAMPYRPAARAPIDCFYVYPTTSDDPTYYSDLAPDASEKRTVNAQAARLGSVCRLFVPIYHQLTMAGLRADMATAATGGHGPALRFDIPYRDVRDAWRAYLAHDNRGRGVVVVGHSQGAILLKRLLAEEVDGKPAQRRLVGAYLAGNPDLTDASFAHLRPCSATGQTGCVVAWSSYRDGAEEERARVFGAAPTGARALCVNPAAPGGGRGLLKTILPRPAGAPEGAPPYGEIVGQLSAECVADRQGNVLRVRVEPSPDAALLTRLLDARDRRDGWGLHGLDIALAQGNMLDLIAAQGAAWGKR